jgi:hypothetical protein
MGFFDIGIHKSTIYGVSACVIVLLSTSYSQQATFPIRSATLTRQLQNSQTVSIPSTIPYLEPKPFKSTLIRAEQGGTVGTPVESIDSIDDVSVLIPAGACNSDTIITISHIRNASTLDRSCLGAYDFGPSGIQFNEPVTITIPYIISASGSRVLPCWRNTLADTLSKQGITEIKDISISSTLQAISFTITHFTQFYIFGRDIFAQNLNRTPVLDPLQDRLIAENSSLRFLVNAVDPDNDQITYAVRSLPAGASFSGQAFNWTPTYTTSRNSPGRLCCQ